MLKSFFGAIAVLFFISIQSYSQNYSQIIRGSVLDNDTKQPVSGATVTVRGSAPVISVITNPDGSFRLENIPVGRIALQISHVGYEPALLSDIIVISGKETVVNASLQQSVSVLTEILVKGGKTKGAILNDMAVTSGRSISPEQTIRYAGGFNDPSKILSNFAGVTNSQDGGNDIIVRGNSPKYVQWRLEGIQITNPNHFADQGAAGGSVSTINNNLLATSDFYSGAFPAEFGDALSGVYDIKLRQGNNEKFESMFGLGATGTELMIEGPFKKGYKGSYLANYRYSTISILKKLNLFDDINGVLDFQDGAFKITLPANRLGTFSLFGLGGKSSFSFKDVDDALWQTPGNRYIRNKVSEDFEKTSFLVNTGVNHSLAINKKSYLSTSIAFSSEGINDKVFENFLFKIYNGGGQFVKDSAVNGFLNFTGKLNKETWRGEITYTTRINSRHKIQVGSKYSVNGYRFRQSMLKDSTSARSLLVDFNENISVLRNFASWRFRVGNNITLVTGIHNMNVLFNKKSTIEPRVGINIKTSRNSSFNIAYGKHSAMESVHHYFAKVQNPYGSITEPNRDLGLLKADHLVIGYQKNFTQHLLVKAEVYYQCLYDLPVANSDTNIFSTINEGLDFQYIDLINKGTGENIGAEITVDKSFNRNYYFLFNASVFSSTYKAFDGVKRNTRYNGDYLINFLFGKEFSKLGKKKNQTFNINGKAFLGGGKKIIPLLRNANGEIAVDPASGRLFDFTKAYKNDIEDIYQVTLSLGYKFNRKKVTHEIFLNIDNLTNTRGRIGEVYNPKKAGSVDYIRQTSIFPNLMYRIYF